MSHRLFRALSRPNLAPGLIALISAVALLAGCQDGVAPDRPGEEDKGTELSLAMALSAGTFRMQALHSSKCVEVSGASLADGAAAEQRPCRNAASQDFRFRGMGAGVFEVSAVHSGKCLEVAGQSKISGAYVRQNACKGAANQLWKLIDKGDSRYQLKSQASGKCLDVEAYSSADGAKLQQWPCANQDNQIFRLAAPAAVADPDTVPVCGYPDWVSGKAYAKGDIARYPVDGKYYIAERANPGYIPVVSTYYWDPFLCAGGGPDPLPDSTPSPLPGDWAKALVTDFAKTGIAGNPNWGISTWGNANRAHSAANVWREGDMLAMKVNGGTPKGQTTTGAEIVTTKRDFLYGSYRILWKTSAEPGTVNGFFYYVDDQSEIDIEILGSENGRGLVHFTVHKIISGNSSVQVAMGFDPSKDFHEYRFDWLKDRVDFFVDGKLKASLAAPAVNVPYRPGYIMLNHWTLSDPGWGGGPPVKDALMYVKKMEFYWN